MVKAPLYITSNGTYIRKAGNSLLLDKEGKERISIPSIGISYIIKWGTSQVSEQVLNWLCEEHIPIIRYSYGGKQGGMFIPPEHHIGKIRLAQYRAYFDEKKRIYIARQIVTTSSYNKLEILRKHYYTSKKPALKEYIDAIKKLRQSLPSILSIDSLRGVEANIAKNYYSGLDCFVKTYKLQGRHYNPPKNEMNCLLSFGYSLLYPEIFYRLFEHGFCPFVGYLHEQNDAHLPLTYDISELFKQTMVDKLVISLVNNGQIKDDYFNKKEEMCLLNTYGKNFFLKQWLSLLRKVERRDPMRSGIEQIRAQVLHLKHYLEEGGIYNPSGGV